MPEQNLTSAERAKRLANYEWLLKEVTQMIANLRKNKSEVDEKQLSELYGIYYNAFTGALRNGVLYSKKMDTDGYPKFVIVIRSIPAVMRRFGTS